MDPGKELILPNQLRNVILDREDVIPEVGLVLDIRILLQRTEMGCHPLRHVWTTDVLEMQAVGNTDFFWSFSAKTDGGPTVRSCKIGFSFCFLVPHISTQNGQIVVC